MEKPSTRRTGGKLTAGLVTKTVVGSIGRFFVTCLMVGIITGCIVACVMTVYILSMIGSEDPLDLDTIELGYTSSILYLNKETGAYEELQKLYVSDNNRIWVNLDEVSDYVKDAVIATEDKRFKEHQGVDWRRTFGAFLGQFGFGSARGGGSTITQQLIKNVTGDDDYRIDRKVREIFRALELEKLYSKERILEAYLNVVPFGAGTNGIQTAALTYFGKDAKDLTLAESAAIVGITQYPGAYSPFLNPEANKKRQVDVLFFMHEQGKITDKEYEAAQKQPLNFKREEFQARQGEIMNYFEDHVYNQVLKDLQEQKGWTENYATEQMYTKGYKIYATVDLDMQKYLEEFFLTTELFPAVRNANYPQACATIIDPNGKMLAVAGGIGEKTGNLMFNRATMARRHPGSSIKPIGTYAVAFEYDQVYWSTMIEDYPITLSSPGRPDRQWPTNYYGGFRGRQTVSYAIQWSVNTIAAKLVQAMGPQTIYDFLHDRLNFYNLVAADIDLAPMSLGALTKGVTPLEMVGGYQIIGNGGTFTAPYCYTKVEDANGKIVLEADTTPRHVISEETSVILNKALQVVTSAGTGTPARLDNMPTAGKTGTSDDDVNQWFIGMTPYYVCQVWLGYDEEQRINDYGNLVPNSIGYDTYPPPKLWKSIMAPLHEGLDYIQFPESENVTSMQYCTETGMLATSACASTASGWYKKSRLPSSCPGHVRPPQAEEGDADSGDQRDTDPPRDTDSDSRSTEPLRVRD